MAMVMTLLLDTHVWLWMLSAPERLNAVTQALLVDRENQLWLSVASVWEVAIKHARGKLPLQDSVGALVDLSTRQLGLTVLPIDVAHDRILVAQAQLESMTLVTADELVARYGPCHWATSTPNWRSARNPPTTSCSASAVSTNADQAQCPQSHRRLARGPLRAWYEGTTEESELCPSRAAGRTRDRR
jgi:PIN domain nuclease of toxin-antitoxin system